VDEISVEDQAALEFEASRTRAAVASLPRAQQDTIHLAFFNGLSHLQVARHMDVPLGTVKGRIRLALGRLRSDLHLQAAGMAW
jgi:RNA polymerase sigma-70 factor (ECF subfamily)